MNNTQKELNKQLFDLLNISFQVTLEKVEKLLEVGASSKAVDEYGLTPLHKAVQTKNTELGIKIIELLIDKYDANINAVTNTGATPLHLALIDNPGIAKFLLFQRKVSTEVFSKGISHPLIFAIQCGNRESAEIMIQHTVLQNPDYPKPDDITNADEDSGLSKFWEKHQTEAQRMYEQDQPFLELLRDPSRKIGNSNISLSQFLDEKDPNKLAGYLSNEKTNLRNELESFISKYPTYASMIESQYNRGMERKDLLSKGEIVLKHSDFKILSEDARNKIASFLTNTKLAEVREAGVLALNEERSDFKVLPEDAGNKVASFLTNTKLPEVREAGALALN